MRVFKSLNCQQLVITGLLDCDVVMAVYNVDESLTPAVPLTAMRTCFMSHLLVLVLVLVSRELVLVLKQLALSLVLVLLQLVLTTTLAFLRLCDDYEPASTGRVFAAVRQEKRTGTFPSCPVLTRPRSEGRLLPGRPSAISICLRTTRSYNASRRRNEQGHISFVSSDGLVLGLLSLFRSRLKTDLFTK